MPDCHRRKAKMGDGPWGGLHVGLGPGCSSPWACTATADQQADAASQIGYHVLRKDGVDFVFADHPSFPRVGGPYADHLGV